MKYCKQCGTQLSEDSKFCSNCGSQIQEDIPSNSINGTEKASDNITENILEEEGKIPPNRIKESYQKYANKLFVGSFASAAFGVILFLGIVLISLIGWGKVYLYDGYDFTATLATISLVFMLPGLVVLGTVFIVNLKLKTIDQLTKKNFTMLSLVLIVLCIVFSTWGFVNYANEQDSGGYSGNGSYGSSYNDYYNSGTDKRMGLSLKVDSIKTSGSYTYIYCTVTNVSSKYVATSYRYVKVKAQFKDRSGSIVDTDWAYAVDSAWLEPGESKTFYYMVRNTDIKSATLSFVD